MSRVDQHTKKVGGGVTLGLGVLVVWLLGRFGVSMSAEVGAVIGALIIAIWGAIWEEGLVGVGRHILRGDGHAESARVASGKARTVTSEEEDSPQT